ncbi:MAG: hypothetical protein LBU09_04780 [Endomicrobium sp.]|nr:hypothetical protein [Endomicrobium sp.]
MTTKKGKEKMKKECKEGFVKRMITEEKELKEKTEKALAFEKMETYEKLSEEEKELLGMQINAMTLYLYFLRKRIDFYTKNK